MVCRKYYTAELKERILKHVEVGHGFVDVVAILHVSKQSDSHWFDDTQHHLSLQNLPKTGGPHKTNRDVDKMIVRTSRSNSHLTAPQILTEISPILDDKISVTTIKRRLGKEGLNGKVGVCKPFIPKK